VFHPADQGQGRQRPSIYAADPGTSSTLSAFENRTTRPADRTSGDISQHTNPILRLIELRYPRQQVYDHDSDGHYQPGGFSSASVGSPQGDENFAEADEVSEEDGEEFVADEDLKFWKRNLRRTIWLMRSRLSVERVIATLHLGRDDYQAENNIGTLERLTA
jgi:hypothetical protein